jgi:transcriptional regulator with XRE-family HTH domain
MFRISGVAHNVHMAKKKDPGHFIRAWRKSIPGLTLERLAERVGTTHATLSRIERGKVPYSQPLLEALAEAMGTTPASLIMRDPSRPGSIWDVVEQIPLSERENAAKALEGFKKTG